MTDTIDIIGEPNSAMRETFAQVFAEHQIPFRYVSWDERGAGKPISLDKQASQALERQGVAFYNWDLLFDRLGPNDVDGEIESKLRERLRILSAVRDLRSGFPSSEVHASIRVHDLAASARFYTWLFGVEPTEWTHRYVTFLRPDTHTNFVLLVSDGLTLHHDILFHLGMGVAGASQVIAAFHSARENGFPIEKPPRTTWRGTPLHELWLKDPDGTLIEIYALLTEEELAQMPADQEPVFLVKGIL